MDWAYMGRLALSVLIFAPGLVILAMALVIGILILLEKAGVLASVSRKPDAAPVGASDAADENPAPDRIVSSLNEAVRGDDEEEAKKQAAS